MISGPYRVNLAPQRPDGYGAFGRDCAGIYRAVPGIPILKHKSRK